MSDNEETRPLIRKRIRTTPWTLGAMALAALYTVSSALRGGQHTGTHSIIDDFSSGLGEWLVNGLIIAAIGYFALYLVVLKRARAGGVHYFVALLGTVMLCGAAVTAFNGQQFQPPREQTVVGTGTP